MAISKAQMNNQKQMLTEILKQQNLAYEDWLYQRMTDEIESHRKLILQALKNLNMKKDINMQGKVIALLSAILGFIIAIAGGYAAVKFGLMGIAHMTKDQQKIREARDGMTNVAIGLIVVIFASAAVAWLQGLAG